MVSKVSHNRSCGKLKKSVRYAPILTSPVIFDSSIMNRQSRLLGSNPDGYLMAGSLQAKPQWWAGLSGCMFPVMPAWSLMRRQIDWQQLQRMPAFWHCTTRIFNYWVNISSGAIQQLHSKIPQRVSDSSALVLATQSLQNVWRKVQNVATPIQLLTGNISMDTLRFQLSRLAVEKRMCIHMDASLLTPALQE